MAYDNGIKNLFAAATAPWRIKFGVANTNAVIDTAMANNHQFTSDNAAGTAAVNTFKPCNASNVTEFNNPNGISFSAGPLTFASRTPGTETTGSLVTTGATWVVHTAVGGCAMKLLCSYIGATGDYATLRMRARSDYAAGSASGVVCGNFSASANLHNHANLFAVQGYAQPNAYTQNDAAHIACGLYSCIDATAASSGRRWSTWIDDHSTTKAAGGHYLLRMSDNGSTAKDGAITIYNGGRLPVLFNFEDAAGFLTDSGSPGTTAAGYIAVKTPAGTKYISLFTA